MKFSLITVTMGDRPEVLHRLVDSLARQTCPDFEHIIVNQSEHSELCGGLSKARNYGLSLAKGEIVAFPDDDAWYDENTLERVASILANAEVDGVSFRVTDEFGRCSAGGYMSASRMPVTRGNVWRTVVSCSFFVKRAVVGSVQFDPQLGVGAGTRFGSGEETDFVLKLLARGARLDYNGCFCIFHPLPHREPKAQNGWRYGNGCGLVLCRHGYSYVRLFWMMGLQFVRALQALVRLRFSKMSFHLAMATGRFFGYFTCGE